MTKAIRHKYSKFALIACTALSLSACNATTGSSNGTIGQRINASLGGILAQETKNDNYDKGYSASDLKRIENTYKSNTSDPKAAVNYARVLREFDYINRASIVLRPFAQDSESPAETKTEFAAIQLANGNYAEAEEFAQKAIDQEPANYDAYHYLGIALDAQGDHAAAETAFRSGLDNWQGDATPIMNNLALNLASQGYFTEAVTLLEKAVTISPDRLELMRNLRIVQTLKETSKEKTRPSA